MKKKRKLVTIILSAVMLLSLMGCGMEFHADVGKDGKITSTLYYYFTKDEVKQAKSGENSLDTLTYIGKKEIDGATYMVYADKPTDATDSTDSALTPHGFYASAQTAANTKRVDMSDATELDCAFMTITFPYEMTYTNGTLSADKKTVTFDKDAVTGKKDLYAYDDTYKAAKTAEFTGISEGTKYTNKKTVNIVGFSEIKDVVLNGKSLGSISKLTLKNGKNTIAVTNEAGTVERTLVLDTKGPKLNVKNGKTYKFKKGFKITATDSLSRMKYLQINDLRCMNGTVSSKISQSLVAKGKYTIIAEDNAGNTTKVVIRVK